MNKLEIQEHTCDICVVGGGLAGCMAAVRAAELNDDVLMVDKSNPERSGCAGTGLDHIWGYFPEVQSREGVSLEAMVEDHIQNVAQGLIHKKMIHYITATAYDRILDLERFGAKIRFDDSTLPGKLRLQYQMHASRNTLHFEGRDIKRILSKAVRKAGARILDRVMITELLTDDGQIAGAVGYGTRDGKIHLIRAKAVIMTTGRINRLYKPYPGLTFAIRMPPALTGDGKAAMFRGGVELINMEFLSIPGRWSSRNLIRGGGLPTGSYQPPGIGVNALGEVIRQRNHDVGSKTVYGTAKTFATGKSFQGELEAGRGPIYADMSWGSEADQAYMLWAVENEGLGPGFLHIMEQYGLDFRKHKIELWPIEPEHSAAAAGGPIVDDACQTSLPGLYAAGDEAGGIPGSVAPGAFTMGYLAAESAAGRAARNKNIPAGAGEEQLLAFCTEILNRSDGYPWEEAQQTVHNIMTDYNVHIRSETMARRALECLEYLSNNMRLSAANPHELTHCLEMRNLIECGKIIFRSTIKRKESRGKIFQRKDYPHQDDANWFCFLGQRLDRGQVRFRKHNP
ncbi:MAG: FAD-dependent oxidoreductase [Spirochaetaceae bacterium]|nr:MAG: FAD-dependent oxidoreductase [Spirochaetaceae bacterium]